MNRAGNPLRLPVRTAPDPSGSETPFTSLRVRRVSPVPLVSRRDAHGR
jgi:hypothetical protein